MGRIFEVRKSSMFARYDRIGVGVIKNREGEFWVTQMFVTNRPPTAVAKKTARNQTE